jgi:hypothetical protein
MRKMEGIEIRLGSREIIHICGKDIAEVVQNTLLVVASKIVDLSPDEIDAFADSLADAEVYRVEKK